MKIFISTVFVALISVSMFAQSADTLNVEKSADKKEMQIFPEGEVQPQYPGGIQALMQFLSENLEYPSKAIDGKVIVTFVIDTEGRVKDVKALRSLNKACDAEAIRVVKMMPRWTPGTIKGEPVNVRFNLPITFKKSKSRK